ncbi:hypothetical protein SAMN02745223_00002 [Devosia limi DSM 17137]|uniref:Uncharacterized protein n=1 Tax=Devosia limi DSM 17137 TaxID=1121477 RepID=A0A1M4SDP7_9HYPH|nr:hypothetical protein SAMN02745223_00002 [Devosia limi DSM 17137]
MGNESCLLSPEARWNLFVLNTILLTALPADLARGSRVTSAVLWGG